LQTNFQSPLQTNSQSPLQTNFQSPLQTNFQFPPLKFPPQAIAAVPAHLTAPLSAPDRPPVPILPPFATEFALSFLQGQQRRSAKEPHRIPNDTRCAGRFSGGESNRI
jgi:hypothetical protein